MLNFYSLFTNYGNVLISFLINYNIYIGLCAVSLTLGTQVLLGMEPQLHPYLFIIFFGTLLEYNLHKIVTLFNKKEVRIRERDVWLNNNVSLFYLVTAISIAGFILSLILAQKGVLITLIPLGIITILYSLPFFIQKRTIFRLREIPGIKVFLIAFIWSSVTVIFPVVFSGDFHSKIKIILLFIERFIFIVAITIPFDIRDMHSDKLKNLKTIPLLFGRKKAIIISNVSLIIFLLITIIHHYETTQSFVLPALFISVISTLYFINSTKLLKLKYYHYGILDGTMLLQGILLVLYYYIFK